MRYRFTVAGCVLLLLLSCVSMNALAFNETLTFRINAQGQVEAVIDGLTQAPGCNGLGTGHEFDPPSSITTTGNAILIQSPVVGVSCSIPVFPPFAYQQIANLGVLVDATYQVTWDEGEPPIHTISATLDVSDLLAKPAPMLSWWATLALLCSILIGAGATRRSLGLR